MGLLDKITRAVSRDLDRRVSGNEGLAEGRYQVHSEDGELSVEARLGGSAQGTLTLELQGGPEDPAVRQAQGAGHASLVLGRGRGLRGGSLSVSAEAQAGPGSLVVLTADLRESEEGAAAYSVESRADDQGRARLRLAIGFG